MGRSCVCCSDDFSVFNSIFIAFKFVFFWPYRDPSHFALVVILLVQEEALDLFLHTRNRYSTLCFSYASCLSCYFNWSFTVINCSKHRCILSYIKDYFDRTLFLCAFFLALILVNDTDDLTVYIPILFLILIVVVAYSILFFRQVKARIRTQTFLKELELAHQQVEELTLANERQRMARDLHDTLAQGLAGIIMQLEAVQAHLENQNTQRAQSIIKGSMSQARKTLGEARMVIDDLRKDRHDQYDLTETVKNEVNRFTTATNIPIRTKISVPQNMSPFFIEHTVYMIKECLTNVSKHAKASHVELVMVQQGDHIHLKIADNGVGFDEKKRESTFGHYGIIGMSERVRLLGGEIHLKSKKNEGTQVIVNIPLKKE